MIYNFTVGDQVVVRQEDTGTERYGTVRMVTGRGTAFVELPATKLFPSASRLMIEQDGKSQLQMFQIIKHVSAAEFQATGKCNV